jgi:hypothetical protein
MPLVSNEEAKMRPELLVHGLRTSILNNATAYGFSVMITSVFAATQTVLQSPHLPELFAYAAGATVAFAAIEAAATSGFRIRARPEPSEVVAVGTALATVSVLAALSAGIGAAKIIDGPAGWFLAAFCATVTYSLLSGVEMALAHRAQREQEPEQEAEGDEART